MDHLFHKNLLAEKHNLEWQLAEANLKIKNLTRKVKYLTENPTITDGNQGSGNVTATPFGPGGYFYPSQLNPPTQNPNQSPSLIPYDGPGPIQPGHYSPSPPPSYDEYYRENPMPDYHNYPDGVDDPEYKKDMETWRKNYGEWVDAWRKWRRERAGGAGSYRLPGGGPGWIDGAFEGP